MCTEHPAPGSPSSDGRVPLFACLYRPASGGAALATIAADFSPRFEVHSEDLAVIDVSGLARLIGPPRAIGGELQRSAAARGTRVHVAMAGTRTAAILLARAQPGLTVVAPGAHAAALAPMTIRLLEQMHDGLLSPQRDLDRMAAAVSAFTRWGIRTLGELAAMPAADLTARVGPQALVWHAIARGDDVRPLVPTLEAERFESSLDLEWPIEGLEPLSFVLTRLLEPLSTRLERRDRGAAVLHVVLRLVTRDTVVRSLQLPSPMRDVRTLRTLALLDLEAHPPGAAIDRVQIVIDPTPGRVLQHALFTRAQPTAEQISTLIARLGALMGADRIGAAAIVDSYRPGAFAMRPFATEHAAPRGPRLPADSGRPGGAGAADPRRARASAVVSTTVSDVSDVSTTVSGVAGVPRAASAGGAVGAAVPIVAALRRCRQPVPARVIVADGRPVRVTTDRRGFAGGAVLYCAGPWRTSGDWWTTRSAPAASDGAFNRDDWDVALGDGAVYRLCRDRDRDAWFIDAIVD
jgi:protein ImuB